MGDRCSRFGFYWMQNFYNISCALLPQDESENFSLIKINVRRFLEFCIARYLLNFQTHFDEANLNKVGEKRENVKSI